MSAVADMAVLTYEEPESEEAYFCALQRQINSGQVWLFEGTVGRGAMAAIEAGLVMLGPTACSGYWDNVIPGRRQVEEGTTGSRQFVVDQRGEEWAAMLERGEREATEVRDVRM